MCKEANHVSYKTLFFAESRVATPAALSRFETVDDMHERLVAHQP